MSTRIDTLTPEQEARFEEWADKWIEIGLRTGKADRERFEANIPIAYEKARLEKPKRIVWVQNPLVLALAAPTAGFLIDKGGGAVDGAIHGAVGDAVDGAIHGAVGDAVGGAIHGAVGDAVRGAVRGAVDGAVRGAVRGAVDGAVGDAVDGAVGDAIHDAVDGAVDDAALYMKNNWYKYLGGQFWVGGWYWGSPAFVSFFTDVCHLELSPDMAERARVYNALCESACWFWPHKDFVMVCERPREIHRFNGRLHYDHGPAIAWEGYELYFLHGVRFEKDLYWRVVNREIGIEDILKNIPNADQRSVALVMAEPADFLKQANAELVSTSVKPTRAKEPTKLYKVPNFMGTRQAEYAMTMFCPSTGRPFLEWVEPEVGKKHDADLAQATAFGITKEQYLSIGPDQEA